MLADSSQAAKRKGRTNGFTMLELIVGMAIISIMTVVAVPSFMQAYRGYQLNDAAYKVAGILKYTHFEAVRLNVATATPLKAQVSNAQTQAGTYIFTDSNTSGTVQQGERQTLFTGAVNLVPPGTPPNTGGLAAAVNVAAFTNISPTNGSISFDQRGAVVPPSVSVLYVGNTGLPLLGYRAIVVLPTGSIQVWSCDSGGNWLRVN
jgi:prepilin-type N-terminal cleavage/methylation domain-containing protein